MSQLIIIAPNPVRQAEYVRLLAERLGVREDAIRGQIRRLAQGRDESRTPSDGRAGPRSGLLRTGSESDARAGAERLLLHLLVADASVRAAMRELAGDATAFREPAHQALAEALLDPEAKEMDPDRLRERLRDEGVISLLNRFLVEEPPLRRADPRGVAKDCIDRIRLVEIDERIANLNKAIAEAERSGDVGRREALQAEWIQAQDERTKVRELKVSV